MEYYIPPQQVSPSSKSSRYMSRSDKKFWGGSHPQAFFKNYVLYTEYDGVVVGSSTAYLYIGGRQHSSYATLLRTEHWYPVHTRIPRAVTEK